MLWLKKLLFFRIRNELTPIAEAIKMPIHVIYFSPERFKADCVAGTTTTIKDANEATSRVCDDDDGDDDTIFVIIWYDPISGNITLIVKWPSTADTFVN